MMGLLDWFFKQLRRPEVRDLELSVHMDRTEDGQHLLRFYKRFGELEVPIDDLAPLLRYGYREEIKGPRGPVIFTVTEQDRQTLLALKSMNPILEDDGALRFDFAPAILKYLRTKKSLEETPASTALQIKEDPPRRGCTSVISIQTYRGTSMWVTVGSSLRS